MMRLRLLLSCVILALARPLHADRDIVYAARYYAPPGSHRTSSFHLYRINADGTRRTQLTFRAGDDERPAWSPDGKRILFRRTLFDQQGDRSGALWVIGADGSKAHPLIAFPATAFPKDDYLLDWQWLPDDRSAILICWYVTEKTSEYATYQIDTRTHRVERMVGVSTYKPSPDGRRVYIGDLHGGTIRETTGATYAVRQPLENPVWIDKQTLAGTDDVSNGGHPFMRLLDTQGHETGRVPLHFPSQFPDRPGDFDQDWAGYGWVSPAPRPDTVVYALNEHNSTVGTLAGFFDLRLADGAMRFIADGQFLAWSPTGTRFVTAPGRDTWTYKERKWDGTFKTVWAAPLEVGSPGGNLRTITPGLVWVTGADWRKGTL